MPSIQASASCRLSCAALAGMLAAACSRPDPGPRLLVHKLMHPENSTGVFLNEELDFDFSGEVDRASVTRESVRIQSRDGVPARGQLLVEGPRVRFLPAPVLARDLSDGGYLPDTWYDVEIAGFPRLDGLRGVHGEPLKQTYLFPFRTVSVAEPRAGLIFDDPDPDGVRPLAIFPPQASYKIGAHDSIYLKSDKPLDPSTIVEDGFQLVHRPSNDQPPIPLRARLIENEPEPVSRGRNRAARSIMLDAAWEQPRAALLELTPLRHPPIGQYQLKISPEALRRGPCDFIGHKVWQPALSSLLIDVADRGPDAGRPSLSLDFLARKSDPQLSSPVAVPEMDGTAHWSDTGRVEVQFPRAAGTGGDGHVALCTTLAQPDVHAVRLDLEAGEICTLSSEPGLVVLRSQGRMTISGKLVRNVAAPGPPRGEGLAYPGTRDESSKSVIPLTDWLRLLRDEGRTYTVLVAGGDLVVESDGEIAVNTPLLLCAGGTIRVEGAVRGPPGLVYLLGDGGGLDIKPAASIANMLMIDAPEGQNPLRERLHLAVFSSPIPPNGTAVSWLFADAQGLPIHEQSSGPAPATDWSVRYVRELAGTPRRLADLIPVDDPSAFEGGGSIQILIELDIAPGGAWKPPFVDFVRLTWEQAPPARGGH